jgi:hypothetical protein
VLRLYHSSLALKSTDVPLPFLDLWICHFAVVSPVLAIEVFLTFGLHSTVAYSIISKLEVWLN